MEKLSSDREPKDPKKVRNIGEKEDSRILGYLKKSYPA